MLTPRYFSNTLAAGDVAPISAYGRHILIASISASTIELSIQDDPWQQVWSGERIDTEDRPYSRLMLRNAGLVASTVIVILSETRVELQDVGGILAGIAASLTSIDQEISGAAACTQLAAVNVPMTGGVGQLLFAANAARRLVSLSGAETNGGFVYIGKANTVSSVDWMDIIYPGGNWYDERYKGPIYGVGDDALEWVGGYEV